MRRAIGRATSYAPPVDHLRPTYARTYTAHLSKHPSFTAEHQLIVSLPVLGDLKGPIARASTPEEAKNRARDLLLLGSRLIGDEYTWAADIDLVWMPSGKPVL